MSTELMIYTRVNDPLAFMREAGTVIAKSRMFGCENIEQGQAMALISMTENLSFLELRRRYHVVDGDLSMRADFMRAEFHRLGGTYVWLKDGEDGKEARAIWKFRENDREIGYTIEDAKREGLVKAKSRWEKDPGSMLRARCTTKAVRMIASEVLAGFYCDEELGGEGDLPPKSVEIVNAKTTSNGTSSDVVDAEIVEAATEEAPFDAPAAASKPVQSESANGGTAGMCTADQSNKVKELFGTLNVSPEKRAEILAKRNAATVRNLTAVQANELIAALTKKLADRSVSASTAAPPAEASKPGNTDAEIAARVKEMAKQVEQTHPGTTKAIREKVTASGAEKLTDLRREDLLSLLSALQDPDKMAAYFGVVIWEAAAKN